jgi:hypothetical protein
MVLSQYGPNWRELRKNTHAALNTDAVKQYYHVQEDYVDTLDESGKPIVPNPEFVSALARFVSVRFSDGLLSYNLLFSFAGPFKVDFHPRSAETVSVIWDVAANH